MCLFRTLSVKFEGLFFAAGVNANEFELQSHHRYKLQVDQNQALLSVNLKEILVKYTLTEGQLVLSDLFTVKT